MVKTLRSLAPEHESKRHADVVFQSLNTPDNTNQKVGLSITGHRVNTTCSGVERLVFGTVRLQVQGVRLIVAANPHYVCKYVEPSLNTMEGLTAWLAALTPETCPESEIIAGGVFCGVAFLAM